MSKIIYLDNNATTPLDPRVLETMMPYFTNLYANASSNHQFGHEANDAVKKARKQIADLVGCDRHEIVFTSGATEAINLAIKGVAEKYSNKGKHIVTCQTEHKAVLDVCSYLEKKGYEVTYLDVDEYGLMSLDKLHLAIRRDTILVSVMLANNETGVIQPIKKISKIAKQYGSLFMTDATQAFGKISIDVNELGIDLMAFSGHKIYGPKGVGGLYVRQNRPYVKLEAVVHGGGHERGFRSGTLNVPGIVGLGRSAELARNEIAANEKNIRSLRDRLEQELLKIDGAKLNGHPSERLYNVCNILFEGVDADALMMKLEGVMVSNGSACTSTEVYPSHVLKSIGRTDEEAYCSIRISLGKYNSKAEIDQTAAEIRRAVDKLRKLTFIA